MVTDLCISFAYILNLQLPYVKQSEGKPMA